MKKTKNKNNKNKKYNIILDIDDTLCSTVVIYSNTKLNNIFGNKTLNINIHKYTLNAQNI